MQMVYDGLIGLATNPFIAFVKALIAVSTSSTVASGLFNTSVAFATSASTTFKENRLLWNIHNNLFSYMFYLLIIKYES